LEDKLATKGALSAGLNPKKEVCKIFRGNYLFGKKKKNLEFFYLSVQCTDPYSRTDYIQSYAFRTMYGSIQLYGFLQLYRFRTDRTDDYTDDYTVSCSCTHFKVGCFLLVFFRFEVILLSGCPGKTFMVDLFVVVINFYMYSTSL